MRAATVLTASLSAALTVAQGTQDAPRISGNPTDVAFEAQLPVDAFWEQGSIDGNVKGIIRAQAPQDGNGVQFRVQFENVPTSGGPFIYHIHAQPVPSDGNCTKTLAHLDPYKRGEDPPCDSKNPETCQVGDLSGKHGKVTKDDYTAEYIDPFLSLQEGDPAYFGDLSFVFHFANKTRITCANFVRSDVEQVTADPDHHDSSSDSHGGHGGSTSASNSTGSGSARPSGTGKPASPSKPAIGSATSLGLSLPLALVSLAALAFAL